MTHCKRPAPWLAAMLFEATVRAPHGELEGSSAPRSGALQGSPRNEDRRLRRSGTHHSAAAPTATDDVRGAATRAIGCCDCSSAALWRVLLVVAAVLLTLAWQCACTDNPVGRRCYIGVDAAGAAPSTTVVTSPAIECPSRECLHVPAVTYDLCTGPCESDSDCDKVPESPCQNGFACLIPTTSGPFCCIKMCVCRDGLDGGITTGGGCDPAEPQNECCNLSGRAGNPTYPGCR